MSIFTNMFLAGGRAGFVSPTQRVVHSTLTSVFRQALARELRMVTRTDPIAFAMHGQESRVESSASTVDI